MSKNMFRCEICKKKLKVPVRKWKQDGKCEMCRRKERTNEKAN